jgi:hypothetical protein
MFLSARIKVAAVLLLSVAIAIVAAYWAGWFRGNAHGVMSERAVWHAERDVIRAEAAAQAEALRSRGEQLSAQLTIARATVRIEYVEVVREIVKVASPVRRAIGADLAGLLNSMSGIRETTERIGSGGVVEARTETSTDSGRPASAGVSERGLADWIAGTVKAYEECRVQATGLIAFAKACAAGEVAP